MKTARAAQAALALVLILAARAPAQSPPAQSPPAQPAPGAPAGQAAPAAAFEDAPKDAGQALRFGVCQFRVADFNPRLQTLAHTVPLLILDRLKELDEHVFIGDERQAWAETLLGDWRTAKLVEKDKLWRQRDAAWLRGLAEERDKSEAAARLIDARINKLEAESPAVYLPDPVRQMKPGELHDKGELYPAPAGRSLVFAKKHGLNFLIYGLVEELGEGVISIETAVYNAILGRETYRGSVPGRMEDVERLAGEAVADCARTLLGRRWGSLAVSAEPDSARITVNGRVVGVGSASLPYQTPGRCEIRIDCEGYLPLSDEIELEPGGSFENGYRLAPRRVSAIELAADPEPATVYLGAVRAGETPFAGSVEGAPSLGLLKKEGYHARLFIAPGADIDQANPARLVPEIIGWKERVGRKREEFYSAFGWFLFTLPIPVLLYGFLEDAKIGFSQVSIYNQQKQDFLTAHQLLYYSYYGSLFVSWSLFANTAFRLAEYIQVVDQSRLNP